MRTYGFQGTDTLALIYRAHFLNSPCSGAERLWKSRASWDGHGHPASLSLNTDVSMVYS